MCIRDRNTALQRGVKKECASPARDRVIRWPHAERKVGREESGVGQDDPCFGAKRGTVSHSYRGPFDALPAAQTWFPGLCVRGGDSLWSGGHGGYGYSRALRGGGDLRWTVYRACLLYTSDAADDLTRVDLGGRRIIKKKKKRTKIYNEY